MFFLKEHLVNNNYEWSDAGRLASNNKSPGRMLFDRMNGEQVLFIINYFCQSIGKLDVTDGRKIEQLITTQLPINTRSEVSVFNWLRGVYLYYSH